MADYCHVCGQDFGTAGVMGQLEAAHSAADSVLRVVVMERDAALARAEELQRRLDDVTEEALAAKDIHNAELVERIEAIARGTK